MEHYISYHVYINSTRYEIIGDTVEFLPHHTKMPFMSSADCAFLTNADLTEALLNPNTESPFAKIGETQLVPLRKLETLFQCHMDKPSAPPRLEHTSPLLSSGNSAPPRVDTPAPPRVAQRINSPYPRVGKHRTPAPTI